MGGSVPAECYGGIVAETEREPGIRIQRNGPYLVRDTMLVRRRKVLSEDGEPLTWQTVEDVETHTAYALCRCGGSANKPFCDGTHARKGFDGTETASTEPYDSRARVMEGTGVTVSDDRSICEHAGFCGNRLTNVWKMVSGTEDSVTRAQMMAMIEHCPSGALSYRLAPGEDLLEPDLRQEIGVVDDGPLFVTGRVRVTRSDGVEMEVRNRITLCRCGASKNKPLCDGSHNEIGFRDSARKPAGESAGDS